MQASQKNVRGTVKSSMKRYENGESVDENGDESG